MRTHTKVAPPLSEVPPMPGNAHGILAANRLQAPETALGHRSHSHDARFLQHRQNPAGQHHRSSAAATPDQSRHRLVAAWRRTDQKQTQKDAKQHAMRKRDVQDCAPRAPPAHPVQFYRVQSNLAGNPLVTSANRTLGCMVKIPTRSLSQIMVWTISGKEKLRVQSSAHEFFARYPEASK